MALLITSLASMVTFLEESSSINNDSEESCFLCFLCFFFLLCLFLFDLLEFVSFDILNFFDDDYDNDGSGSRFPGTCDFPFCSDEYVGSTGESIAHVRGVGSRFFPPTVNESIGDVVPLVVFVPIGVEYKGGQLIEIFFRSKDRFSLLVSKSVLEL